MKIHRTSSYSGIHSLDTEGIRKHFLLSDLFEEGQINLYYTDLDRAVVGGISPHREPLSLTATDELRADYFFERREAGVINVGMEEVQVSVDESTYALLPNTGLYIGRGSREVSFQSVSENTGQLYFVSVPAHIAYPTCVVGPKETNVVEIGSPETANERIIYQMIHEGGVKSCQLVMGYTEIKKGSVWNTMPPHTHERRSEYYLYYDLPKNDAVFHLMGAPQETRHLVVRDKECVLSPPWSIHAGCGTAHYKFVWAMGGENQSFTDMDPVPVRTIK